MKHDLSEHIRGAGYETLFLVAGPVPAAFHPTLRNLEKVFQLDGGTQARRQQLKRLEKRGLIETGPGSGGESWVARLTDLGQASFAGGRHPEPAWNRRWDGHWRLLTYDLPRSENAVRMKFRRWLEANYFGRIQGSVWITPDPVPSFEEILEKRIDRANFMVFEGCVAGAKDPREVAEASWDFPSLDTGYRSYCEITTRTLESLHRKTPPVAQIKKILHEDRRRWWDAVRRDPLLPRALLPKRYEGTEAWKIRGKLLKHLGKALEAGLA